MARKSDRLSSQQISFISAQKIFFVATTAADCRINLSPKGLDSFRVINDHKVVWLNKTGSGNETAAHVKEDPRMTIMFCAFEGNPEILRLYGTARAIYRGDEEWEHHISLFGDITGARQIFEVDLDLVQSSCGYAVPLFDYIGERELLDKWAGDKGETGIRDYWKEKNLKSIDGKPTGMKL